MDYIKTILSYIYFVIDAIMLLGMLLFITLGSMATCFDYFNK